MRRTPAIPLIALAALAGCGGSDHERVNPERMLDEAAQHRISSADLEIEARLRVLGVQQLTQPIRVRFEGPYVSGGGERIPSFDWRLSASAVGFPVGGRLLSTGDNVYLSIYGNQYEVGRDSVAAANARLAEVGGLSLDLRHWLGPAHVTGDDSAGGTDCEQISAPLRRDVTTRDLAPFAEVLGLPEPLAVSGRMTACVGYDDRVFHEVELDAALGVPAADRARLGGATGALLSADVVISDVGQQEEIKAPSGSFRPIRDLFLTINDLAGAG
jgi:hypothetical protein